MSRHGPVTLRHTVTLPHDRVLLIFPAFAPRKPGPRETVRRRKNRKGPSQFEVFSYGTRTIARDGSARRRRDAACSLSPDIRSDTPAYTVPSAVRKSAYEITTGKMEIGSAARRLVWATGVTKAAGSEAAHARHAETCLNSRHLGHRTRMDTLDVPTDESTHRPSVRPRIHWSARSRIRVKSACAHVSRYRAVDQPIPSHHGILSRMCQSDQPRGQKYPHTILPASPMS